MRFTRTLGVHKSCRRRKLDFIFTACLLIACRERKLPPPPPPQLNHFANAANGAKRKVTRFPLVKNGFMRLPTQLGPFLSLISSAKVLHSAFSSMYLMSRTKPHSVQILSPEVRSNNTTSVFVLHAKQ